MNPAVNLGSSSVIKRCMSRRVLLSLLKNCEPNCMSFMTEPLMEMQCWVCEVVMVNGAVEMLRNVRTLLEEVLQKMGLSS